MFHAWYLTIISELRFLTNLWQTTWNYEISLMLRYVCSLIEHLAIWIKPSSAASATVSHKFIMDSQTHLIENWSMDETFLWLKPMCTVVRILCQEYVCKWILIAKTHLTASVEGQQQQQDTTFFSMYRKMIILLTLRILLLRVCLDIWTHLEELGGSCHVIT